MQMICLTDSYLATDFLKLYGLKYFQKGFKIKMKHSWLQNTSFVKLSHLSALFFKIGDQGFTYSKIDITSFYPMNSFLMIHSMFSKSPQSSFYCRNKEKTLWVSFKFELNRRLLNLDREMKRKILIEFSSLDQPYKSCTTFYQGTLTLLLSEFKTSCRVWQRADR